VGCLQDGSTGTATVRRRLSGDGQRKLHRYHDAGVQQRRRHDRHHDDAVYMGDDGYYYMKGSDDDTDDRTAAQDDGYYRRDGDGYYSNADYAADRYRAVSPFAAVCMHVAFIPAVMDALLISDAGLMLHLHASYRPVAGQLRAIICGS
jgi:hypothetical protein